MRINVNLEDMGEDSTLRALSSVWEPLRDITRWVGTGRKGERRDTLIRVSEEYLHSGAPLPCAVNQLRPRWLTRSGRRAVHQRVWAFPMDTGLWAALLRWWDVKPTVSPVDGTPVWAGCENRLRDRLYGRGEYGARTPYAGVPPVNAVAAAWACGRRILVMALDEGTDPMSALMGVKATDGALRAFARSMVDGTYHRQQRLDGGLDREPKTVTRRRTPRPRKTRARKRMGEETP